MCDKKCFTKKEAESALNHVNKRNRWRRETRTYYCEEHGSWHLTSHELIDYTIPVNINLKYKKKWNKIMKLK